MSHTPGPWENIYINEKNTAVAFMPSTEQLKVCLDKEETMRENARLIAAAPELLQALKCALADLEGSLEVNNNKQWYAHDWKAHKQSIKDARVAIAKAIGESK
jgi:hypothetical protein